MIYSNIRIPIPQISGYVQPRGGVRYMYAYIGERRRDARGRSTHPAARMIGRIEAGENGVDMLMPNDSYYEIMHEEPPKDAVAEGPGRKGADGRSRSHKADGGAAPEKKAQGGASMQASALGLAAAGFFRQDGVFKALAGTLPYEEEDARRVLVIAAALAGGADLGLDSIREFESSHMPFIKACGLGPKGIRDTLRRLSESLRAEFSASLAHAQGRSGGYVLFDISSFASKEGRRFSWYRGPDDHDELAQSDFGLLCGGRRHLPLAICAFQGSLNDQMNFTGSAFSMAASAGIRLNKRNLTIVTEGGMFPERLWWGHLDGYRLISPVPMSKIPEARKAYLDWALRLDESEYSTPFRLNSKLWLSSRMPYEMGGIGGYLVRYRDVYVHDAEARMYSEALRTAERRLAETRRAPDEVFDAWAQGHRPFFKITRDGNSRGFEYARDEDAIRAAQANAGSFALFTTCKDMDDCAILDLYLQKYELEESSAMLCNSMRLLEERRGDSSEGSVFALLAALILRRKMDMCTKQWQDRQTLAPSDAIKGLLRIRLARKGERWIPEGALDEKQRELLDCAGIREAIDHCIA